MLRLIGEWLGLVKPPKAVETTPLAYLRRWQTTEAEMDAAGWTLPRFRTARSETESRVDDVRLETLRRESWALAVRPRPLHAHIVTAGAKSRVVETPHPEDRVLLAVWGGLAVERIEPQLAAHVHGFRRGRSVRTALRALAGATLPDGGALVRCDVKKMFPSLQPTIVLAAADAALGDDLLGERLRRMLRLWLQAWSNGKGLPTGISISPMLSNLVMAQAVDGWMADQLASGRFEAGIRYADDLALVTADPERTLDDLRARLATAKLHLNEDKTRVIREEGPWPEVVLGVPIGLAGGRLAPRLVKTSPPRRKGRESR